MVQPWIMLILRCREATLLSTKCSFWEIKFWLVWLTFNDGTFFSTVGRGTNIIYTLAAAISNQGMWHGVIPSTRLTCVFMIIVIEWAESWLFWDWTRRTSSSWWLWLVEPFQQSRHFFRVASFAIQLLIGCEHASVTMKIFDIMHK